MDNVGLVLEGGGMRGLYTAGVLEYFMEKELYFPYVIGVSAGACMAASYLSRQKGRNKRVNIGFAKDKRYLSYRNLIFKRQMFGMDFLFDEIPNKLDPFDFETFTANQEKFVIGTTDCESGEPVYYNKHEHGDDLLTLIRASSSLPIIAPSVPYGERNLLDGGIIDPIPIKKAITDGYTKNVIIMTKPKGYRKEESKFPSLLRFFNKKYPKLAPILETRYKLYNDTLDYIEAEEKKGTIYVIQPSREIDVGRIERKTQKLTELYELGQSDAKNHYEKLLAWQTRSAQLN